MPNSCNINDMKNAFDAHQMLESDFDAAVEAFSDGDLNPSIIATTAIRDLVYNNDCSENCVVFTSKDDNSENAIWYSVELKTDRYVSGKYINNPGTGDIQTTFSLELLNYIVEHTSDNQVEFYKGSFSYGIRFLIKYQDKSGNAEFLNFGDVGPV